MSDRLEFAIIRSSGKDYLCYRNDNTYVDVSMPMLNFSKEEDEFEILSPDSSYRNRIYEYNGQEMRVEPAFYSNGWPAICVINQDDENDYEVLTVNLEELDAIGVPNRTFVDCNNHPEAMEFLVKNGFATDTGYKRRSDFIEYPLVQVNLVKLYQHNPEVFGNVNIIM